MTKREWEMKKIFYKIQRGRCNAPCEDYARGIGEKLSFKNMELDHIIAGGSDEISNRQGLCGNCNKVKGKRGMEYLMKKLGKRWESMQLPLFNSRAKRRQPIEARKEHRSKYRGPGLLACAAGFLLSNYWCSLRR